MCARENSYAKINLINSLKIKFSTQSTQPTININLLIKGDINTYEIYNR